MIRSGATGRGATPGKASPGLVYTVVKLAANAQFETAELHASTWKLRSALNRLSPGPDHRAHLQAADLVRGRQLDGHRLAADRSGFEVVPLGALGVVDQVALVELVPSLDATVAPLLDDAQFVGIATVTVDVWPAVNVLVNRNQP